MALGYTTTMMLPGTRDAYGNNTSKNAILCVDDEAIILIAMKQELRRHYGARFIYETAMNAEEAFTVINELQADNVRVVIIISDWLMPGMKGDEFLVLVKQRFPHVATIMVTGQADEAAIRRAMEEAQLHACIKKTWSANELTDLVDEIMACNSCE